MKAIDGRRTHANLFELGRNVSFALPFGASTLRPMRDQIKAAAERLRISTAALAEHAFSVFTQ